MTNRSQNCIDIPQNGKMCHKFCCIFSKQNKLIMSSNCRERGERKEHISHISADSTIYYLS
uniref:Uncharacterized protein n=1 Tax=Rhizophora mucronata TaxID=61149 RepID=A0A2P2PQ93_RHIMU